MLKVKNLTFRYPHKAIPVFEGLDMDINSGGVYGLLGKNGAGKSTLLYLMAGLLTPGSGRVELFGVDTRQRRPQTMRDIFIVPEEFDLPPVSLKKYLRLNSQFYSNFSMEDLHRHLQTFDLDADMHLERLSMGQKKKVYMSFALACNTPLLLMDEPTNGLDIPGKASFRSFIASAMNDERAVVVSTHQVRDIQLLLDHVVIIDGSAVLLDASIPDVTRRLAFKIAHSPEQVATALYAQPSVQGMQIVTENTGSDETEVDLEMLFSMAMSHPETLRKIFPVKSKTEEQQ